jgi:menaquinol-cytochrome c reductase iron-sulfur subunit
MATPSSVPPQPDRRDFLAKAAATVIGGGLALAAPVAGLGVLLDPLRRKSAAGSAVRVASLASLPDDGVPRKFPVLATRQDAWNRTANVPVGAVYLRREKGGAVRAFNVVCPHAGCFVDFHAEQGCYLCPCHNSTFALDGKVLDEKSPSPRALDELPVEMRGEGEIWVAFQNFRPGEKERLPV